MLGDTIYIFAVKCKPDEFAEDEDTMTVAATSSLTAFVSAFEQCKLEREYEPQVLIIASSAEFLTA